MSPGVKIPMPLRVPELASSLGRLLVPRRLEEPWVPLDDLREDLATRVMELAGQARAAGGRDERAQVLESVSRRAWLAAWEATVRRAAERVTAALDGEIERATRRVRMPARQRRRRLLTGSEKRAIAARLAAGGESFVAALDVLETAGLQARDAGVLDKTTHADWQDALRATARRLEAAWLALHLEEDVHVGIPLEPQHRVPQPVDLDAPIDAQRLGEAEPLEDRHHGIRISHVGLGLRAAPIWPLFRVPALPAEHTVRRSAGGRPEHPQPQDLVPIRQPVTAVEAPVEHVAPELEHRARTHQRGAQRGGIIDPRLDLELVDGCGRGPAHAKMASRTAAVSASVANTYAAPAARSAATS